MDYVKSLADEYKPWRRGISWWAVSVQGVLALLVGLYFLLAPDSANSTIRFLLAAILIVSSVIDIRTGFNGVKFPENLQAMAPYQLVRGGAGIALGVNYFVASRSEYMTEENARYLLGFGMIAYAIVGLVGVVAAALGGQFAWPAVLSNALFLLIGAVLVYNKSESVESNDAVEYLGVAALIGGAALLIYSYFLKKDQEAAALLAPAIESAELAPVDLTGTGTMPPAADATVAATDATLPPEVDVAPATLPASAESMATTLPPVE